MTNEDVIENSVSFPFEVVAVHDNGSQLRQTDGSPPPVNVKIKIRNKEVIGKGKHGLISIPKLSANSWPKKVRLVSSDQTIMSFNLTLEPNQDETGKKSHRRLLQMFRPGGCLNVHNDEDEYTYMPSTSNELKRKSASGIDDLKSNTNNGTFSLKKNVFSSSYTDTLKTTKPFLGKCKPGGCLDPPFGEDKYTYKPTLEESPISAQTVQKTDINKKSLDPNINATVLENQTQDKPINILHKSYTEAKEDLEDLEPLVTYPSSVSSSELKNKDSPSKKSKPRMSSGQLGMSKRITNEFPDSFFLPPKKKRDDGDNDEKEYINKKYTAQSQTPSEQSRDVTLPITSPSYQESLQEVIHEKQTIKETSAKPALRLRSEYLSNELLKSTNDAQFNISDIDVIKANDKTSFLEQKYSSDISIIENENRVSKINEIKNVLNNDITSLKSMDELDTNKKIESKNIADEDSISETKLKEQAGRYLNLSQKNLMQLLRSSIGESVMTLDNYEKKDNEINIAEVDVKRQTELRNGENNILESVEECEKDNFKYTSSKDVSVLGTNFDLIKDDRKVETDDFENVFTLQVRTSDSTSNSQERLTPQIEQPKMFSIKKSESEYTNIIDEKINKQTEKFPDEINGVPYIASKISTKLLSPRISVDVTEFVENTDKNLEDGMPSIKRSESIISTKSLNKNININDQLKISALENTPPSYDALPSNIVHTPTLESYEEKHGLEQDTKSELTVATINKETLQFNAPSPSKSDLILSKNVSVLSHNIKSDLIQIQASQGNESTQRISNPDSLFYRKISNNFNNKIETEDLVILKTQSLSLESAKNSFESNKNILIGEEFYKEENELINGKEKSFQSATRSEKQSFGQTLDEKIDETQTHSIPLSKNIDNIYLPSKISKDSMSTLIKQHSIENVVNLDKEGSEKSYDEIMSHKINNIHSTVQEFKKNKHSVKDIIKLDEEASEQSADEFTSNKSEDITQVLQKSKHSVEDVIILDKEHSEQSADEFTSNKSDDITQVLQKPKYPVEDIIKLDEEPSEQSADEFTSNKSDDKTQVLQKSKHSVEDAIILDKELSEKSADEFISYKSDNNIQDIKNKYPNILLESSPKDNKSRITSPSSIALKLGFRSFANESGKTIETFDPFSNFVTNPTDKITTVQTILRDNDSGIRITIDSETDLTMQMKKHTKLFEGSKKVSNGGRDDIRASFSETSINKEELLKETLKSVYENLIPLENIIANLKEEADTLFREQLLLKKKLSLKETRSFRIIPTNKTCSCLQKEIGIH